ncbi:hypothetical protein D3C87_1750360 [compost metagenome]
MTISGIRMAPTPVPVMAMPSASPRCRENLPTRIFVKDKGEVAPPSSVRTVTSARKLANPCVQTPRSRNEVDKPTRESRVTRRAPYRSITCPMNGAAHPSSTLLIREPRDAVPRVHPNSAASGFRNRPEL